MRKLVLIDGNAVLHRAFHAIPHLTTKKGELINAVYGFVSILLNVIQNLKPTHIAVCFDEKEKTFRHKEFPQYQSQRPPTHDDLSSQFGKAKEFLKTAGIPIYSKSGYEADDVIGTVATRAQSLEVSRNTKLKPLSSNFSEVVIVTGDRDMLQLVSDEKNIKLFMPIGGLSNGKLYGEAETTERMGVPPSQIADLKSLIGDPSDNYKGVAGIGPKTAIGLLSKYNSKDEIYKHLQELPEKIREKLEKGKKDAQMSHKLATIIKDVPFKFDFDDMNKWNLGNKNVIKLFEEEFGFKTLTQRTISVSKKIEEEKQMTLL